MKRVVSKSLNLVVIVSFLPFLAMEKDRKSLTPQSSKYTSKRQGKTQLPNEFLLSAATRNNYQDLVHALKIHASPNLNANPDAKNEYGYTSLHHAMRNGNYAIIKFLLWKNADPFIENIYRNSPLLYLNIKTPPFELMSIVTDITNKGITQQMRSTLEKLSIEIKKDDDITSLFNEKVSNRTEYIADFYTNLLRQLSSFLLLAFDERTEKTADTLVTLHENIRKNDNKIQLDIFLPYFNINEAQEKISQLFQIIKMMNNVTFNFYKKQLILPKEIYNLHFDKANLHILKSNPNTHKIYEFLFQLKTIIDDPSLYRKEINKKITECYSDHMAEKVKSSASFFRLVTLIEKKFYFPTFNKEEIIDYIKRAPPSKISSEWFALAITTFAKMREFKVNQPTREKSSLQVSLLHRKTL